MGFFGGLASGFGEAQGQYNQKMLDFVNEKSHTMAQLYGHLADTILQSGGDQDIAGELLNRAKGWASANPILDPKGYKQLIKGEKSGLHDLIEQSTQKKVSDYHSQQFGTQPSQPTQPPQQATAGSQGASSLSGIPTSLGGSEEEERAPIASQGPSQGTTAMTAPQQAPNVPPNTSLPNIGGGAPNMTSASIPDMLTSLSGGQPLYGSMGIPTPMGKMAMGVIPDVVKQRLEMQYKMQLMSSMFSQQTGLDRRSPTGSEQFAAIARMSGLNAPVTQWRPIARGLFQDNQGKYFISPAMQSWRDGSTWIRTGPGQEVEVQPVDENPRIETAKDGSIWAITAKGPIKLEGQMPIQTGTSSSVSTTPTPGGGTVKSETTSKVFSGGSSALPRVSNIPPPPGTPSILPKGVQHPTGLGGPPTSRVSTPKPSQAYQRAPNGEFNLEKLENSLDPTDRSIANYVKHPEAFDSTGPRKEMWDREFQKRGLSGAPTPVKELKYADFDKQRGAIVNGMHAALNIKNILTDTNGALVGMVAGRWIDMMNRVGYAKGISAFPPFSGSGGPDTQAVDFTPDTRFGKDLVNKLAQERPELAHTLLKNQDVIAAKAADLITTSRLFNFADVRNVIGGVQGVAKTYSFLKSSLLNPGMDLPLILGHLSSLDRNMADGLYTLESARWGDKIPYIREKELMSNLYWDSYMNGMVNAVVAKHPGMSKQDALFLLWRNGRITADPGNPSGIGKK